MKVEFNTIYDKPVRITSINSIYDSKDAVSVSCQCGDQLKVFLDATDDCTPLFYADSLAIPKSCIKNEIICKE